MVFDENLLFFFHFLGPDNLKKDDNSKSPNNKILFFAMQQETCAIYFSGKSPKTSRFFSTAIATLNKIVDRH